MKTDAGITDCAEGINRAGPALLGSVEIDNVYNLSAKFLPKPDLRNRIVGEYGLLGVIALDQIHAPATADIHGGNDSHGYAPVSSLALARSTSCVKWASSATAISASIFRLTSISAIFSPRMN